MIVTPAPHGLEDVLGKSALPRSETLHVSTIYNDLYARLEPERFGDKGDSGPPAEKLEAGLTFEAVIEAELKRRLSRTEIALRPGEIVSPEGIYMSPDLILANGEVRVGEIKLTWMSMREMPLERATSLPQKFGKWDMQMRAYCHCLGTPYAKLIGFFVNGDYRPPTPRLMAWEIEYSARDLQDNWRTIVNHGRAMGVLR